MLAKISKSAYHGNMTEREILQALKNNEPFKGLPNVRVENFQVEKSGGADSGFDAQFDIQYGNSKVRVYVEAKSTCTPKQVEQIAPWLSRLKTTQKGAAIALVCPALSPQSQKLCLERNVDFIDLAGNVYINVPGKMLLQRVGMEARQETSPSYYRNPFSGKASRILRVLLEGKLKRWTLSEIVVELAKKTDGTECADATFEVSFSLASRVLRSLEEELLIARWNQDFFRSSTVFLPEPRRLLTTWAQKYKARYRWYLRRSFKVRNPFGENLESVQQDLDRLLKPNCYAFTGAAAASKAAPFVDVDPIDLYVSDEAAAENLRKSVSGPSIGPDLRVIYPFDAGVFLYSYRRGEIPVVSDIQAYLDLFARGGRDLKQADYLLQTRIEPMWSGK